MTTKERIKQLKGTSAGSVSLPVSSSGYNLPVASSSGSVSDRLKVNAPTYSDNTRSLFAAGAPNKGDMTPAWVVNTNIAADEENNAARRKWAQTGTYDPSGNIAASERRQKAASSSEAYSPKSLTQIREEIAAAREALKDNATAKQNLQLNKIQTLLDEAQENANNAANAKAVSRAAAELKDTNFTENVTGLVSAKATGRDDLKQQALATQENENTINAANDANRLSQLQGDSTNPEKAKEALLKQQSEYRAQQQRQADTDAQIAEIPALQDTITKYNESRINDASSYGAVKAAQNAYSVPQGMTSEQGQTWLYLVGKKENNKADEYKSAVYAYNAAVNERTQKAATDEKGTYTQRDMTDALFGKIGLSAQTLPKKQTQAERWQEAVSKEQESKTAYGYPLVIAGISSTKNTASSAADRVKPTVAYTGAVDKDTLLQKKIARYTQPLKNDDNAAAVVVSAYNANRDDKATEYMTDEEKVIYYYNLGAYGKTRADAFAETIGSYIDQRKAIEKAGGLQEWFSQNGAREALEYSGSASIGAMSGLSEFFTNVGQTLARSLGFTAPADDTVATMTGQYYASAEDNKVKKFSYDLGSNIGANVVPMIVNAAVSALTGGAAAPVLFGQSAAQLASLATFGASVFGASYKRARAQGYGDGESMAYSVATTSSEVAMEYLLGAIPGLKAAGGLSETLKKSLTSAASSIAKTSAGRAALRGAAVVLSQAGSEFVEETLQGVLEPVISNITLGTDETVDMKQALYEGLLGAINGIILNVPSTVSESAQTKKLGSQVLSNETALSNLLDDTDANGSEQQKRLAAVIRSDVKKASAADVGTLAVAYAARQAAAMDDGVVQDGTPSVGSREHADAIKQIAGVDAEAEPTASVTMPDSTVVYTYEATDENGVKHTYYERTNGTNTEYWTDISPTSYTYDRTQQRSAVKIASASEAAENTGSETAQQASEVSLPSETEPVSAPETIGTKTESAANADTTPGETVSVPETNLPEIDSIRAARQTLAADSSGEKINSYDERSIGNADNYDAFSDVIGHAVDVRSDWGEASYEDGAVVLDSKSGLSDAAPVAVAAAMLKNENNDEHDAAILREYDGLGISADERLDKDDTINRMASVIRALYTNPIGFAEFIKNNKAAAVAVRNTLKKFAAGTKAQMTAPEAASLSKSIAALTAAIDNPNVKLPGVKKEAAQNTPKPAENKETSPVKKTNASSEGKDTTQTKPSERKGEAEEKQESVEVKKTEEKEKPKLPTKAAAKPATEKTEKAAKSKTAETEKAANAEKNTANAEKNTANAETETAAEASKKEATQKKVPQKSPAEKTEGKPKLPKKETVKKEEGKIKEKSKKTEKAIRSVSHVAKREIADEYGTPLSRNGDIVKIVDSMVEEFENTGSISEHTIEEAHEIFSDLPKKIDPESRDDVLREAKRYLKTTPIYLSPGAKKSIYYLQDTIRRAWGRLRLVSAKSTINYVALGIDSAYQELNELFGEELFPSEIVAEGDMLEQMIQVSILTNLDNMDEYAIDKEAQNEYAIDKLTDIVANLKRSLEKISYLNFDEEIPPEKSNETNEAYEDAYPLSDKEISTLPKADDVIPENPFDIHPDGIYTDDEIEYISGGAYIHPRDIYDEDKVREEELSFAQEVSAIEARAVARAIAADQARMASETTAETQAAPVEKEAAVKQGSDTTQTENVAEAKAAPVKKAKAEGSAEAQKKKQEHAKKIANYYGAADYKDEANLSLLLINSDGNSRFLSADPDVQNGGTELSNRDSVLLRVDTDDLSEYYKRGQGTSTAVSAQTLSNRIKNGSEQNFDKERYRLARYIERAEKAKADALLPLSERAYQAKTGNVDDVYFKAGDAWYNIRRSTMDLLDGADTLFLLPGVHSEKGKTSPVLIAKDANGSVSGVVILSNRGNADGNESGGKSVSVDMDGSVVIRSVSGKNTKTSKGEPYREGYFKNAGEVQKIRAFAASVFEEETGETLLREQKPINRIFESDEAFFNRGSAPNTTGASDALDAIRKIVSERTRAVRRGKLSSHTSAGQYSEGAEVIRLRDAKNIRTLLHEFGHRIDHEQNISPLFREVLESIVPERVANTYAARGDDVSKEGFAEFYLQYVTDKAYAEELSPQIVAWLDEHLTEDNRVASDSIRDQWSLYAQRDSLGRLKSAVVGAEKLKDRKAVRLPGSMRLVDKLKTWAVDSFTGLRRFEQEAENRGNDAPVVLPSTFVRNLSSVQARTAQLIDGDRFYTMGNRVISDTRTERQIYEKAIDYAKENVKTGRYKDEQDYMDTLNAYLVLGSALGWNEQLLTDKDFVPMRFFADKSIDPTNKQTYLKMMDIFNTLTLQNPEFLEIRRQLHSLILDVYKYYAVYSGKMSVSEFGEMQKNPLYIPLNRVMEDTAYDGVNKSGIPTDAPILHRIKGSTRSVQDPFVNIARQIDSVVNASYEHRAVKSIFDMADRINNSAEFGSGVGDYIERVRPDREKVVVNAFDAKADLLSELKGKKYDDASLAEISEAWDSAIGPTVSNWRMVTDNRRGSNTVVFKDNGTYKAYVVGEAVLSALKNVNPAPLNSFLQVVSRMKRFYTALLTSLNPMFAIGSNAPRDVASALIQGGEKNPVRFAAHYLSSLSESAKSYAKGKPSSNEMALFASLGGMSLSELSQTKDPQRYQRYITDKFSRSMDSDAKKKLRSVSPERVIDAIEKFNNVIEAAPRFSEFKRVLEETGSVDNAMLAAKEVTTNFATRGSGIRGFLSFIPFGNAGIQGVYRAYKTLIEGEAYDARSRAQVRAGAWAKLSAIASTAAIEVALLSLIDDDEEKAYQNLSSYVKNNYFVVPKGNGEFLTIKKPENYSVIISLAERLAEWTIGQNPEAWYGFLGYAWGQLVPIIPSPFEENNDLTLSGASQSVIGGLVGDVIIVGTLFDLFVTNKNYRGAPIVPIRLQDRAGAQQVDASTSWLANFVAQGLNSLFNTDKASPMKLDYAIQNNFGFLATLNANFTVPDDWAEAVSSGKGEDLNKVFPNVDVEWENGLLARFTRGFSKNALYSTDVTNRFYGQREDVNADYKSYKETEDGGKYALAYQRYAQMADYLTDIREYVNRADAAGDTELSVKILTERNDAIRALLNDTRTQEETEVDNWLSEKYVGSNTLFRPYNLKTEISVTQDVLGGKNKLTLALDYDMYQELYERIDDAIYTTYLQLYRKEQAEDTAYYTDSDIQSAKNAAVKEVLNAYILENKSKAVTTPVADSSVTRYTASQVLSSDDPESVVRYNLSGYSDAAVEEAVSLFNTFSDDETLTESSVNAKITNLFPSETPKSFTAYRSDGQSETFEMTQLEQDEYAVRYQSAAQDAVNGLTNSRPWSDMNSDSKAKAYGYAFDYAAYQAKNETLDAAQSTLSASGSSSWLDKMETAMEECGISASDYVSLKAKLSEITAVGDTTGAQRKRAYIDSLGYKNSDALKESLGCPEPKGSTSSSTSSSAAYDAAAYKANLSTFSSQLRANSAYAYLTPEQKQTADGYLNTYARYAAHFYKDDDNDGVDDRQTQWIEKALASGVDMMTVLSARAAIADISGTGAADKKRVALAKMRSAGLMTQSEYTKILKAFNLL